MSDFTNNIREVAAYMRGAIAARPNDPDREPIGNIIGLLEVCADKTEEAEQQLAAKVKQVVMLREFVKLLRDYIPASAVGNMTVQQALDITKKEQA